MTTATAERAPVEVARRAREFLAATVNLNPDAPRTELVRLLWQYRAHLAAVLAGPGSSR